MSEIPDEFDLIGQYFAPLAHPDAAFGLTDDAAQLGDWVLTKDMIVEGVHFFADDPPRRIAQKALRVNLSDLAAKGARPVGYLMSINVPDTLSEDWFAGFHAGLAEDQSRYDLSLLGGDTVYSAGPLSICITAIGQAPSSGMVRRAGAQVGDAVVVTGSIGDAWLGLKVRAGSLDMQAHNAAVVARYQMPQPRLLTGQALAHVATASADVSDGLLADLNNIAKVSGVRIVLDAGLIPVSQAAQYWLHMDAAHSPAALWTGGDDFEIVATVSDASALVQVRADSATPIHVIGRVEAGAGVAVVDETGCDMTPGVLGYQHRPGGV